jgi:hypothetical protein
VHIITNIVSFNPAHGEVYSIQHYMIKFDSDLQQVTGFPCVVRFPTQIKLTAIYIHVYILDLIEILLKVALNTITLTLTIQ